MQWWRKREEEVWYSGKIVEKKKEGKEEEQKREGEEKGKKRCKTNESNQLGDKSRAEPNDFRQFHLECQIGF